MILRKLGVEVRLKPDTTDVEVRLKPDATDVATPGGG
jgi:hypothetical protein